MKKIKSEESTQHLEYGKWYRIFEMPHKSQDLMLINFDNGQILWSTDKPPFALAEYFLLVPSPPFINDQTT
jgi:hypothetical protein